jgi:hypothetical protein
MVKGFSFALKLSRLVPDLPKYGLLPAFDPAGEPLPAARFMRRGGGDLVSVRRMAAVASFSMKSV